MENKKQLWKNIAKCTGKALLFGFLIAGSLALLSVIFIPKGNDKDSGIYTLTNHMAATAITGEPEDTIDVLFLGDSEVYSAYIPLQMWNDCGWTSYDLGTGAQRLYETVDYLKLALKTQKPSVVVLDTNCLFRRCSPEQSWYDVLSEAIPAVKYHDRWKTVKKDDLTLEVNNTFVTRFKGYYYKGDQVAAEAPENKESSDELKTIPKMNYLYIQEIVNICSRNGIKLLLVTSPSLKNGTEGKHNRCLQLAEKYGLAYVDLNDESNLPQELCIDWEKDSRDGGDHLNEQGAQKTTTRVEAFINNEAELTDHRTDEAYSRWNDDYHYYAASVLKQ